MSRWTRQALAPTSLHTDATLHPRVVNAQDSAHELGLNVVRTWAFSDGRRSGALQPRAWERDEAVFLALDGVVAQASLRGVRLLLTLTNSWADYGVLGAAARAHCVCACADTA
jgi:hypothetical protein